MSRWIRKDETAGLVVASESTLIDAVEIVRPMRPVERPLVGHRHPLPGRVGEADDRAGRARRPVTGGREFVDVERAVAPLAELECDSGANHPGADHDSVV